MTDVVTKPKSVCGKQCPAAGQQCGLCGSQRPQNPASDSPILLTPHLPPSPLGDNTVPLPEDSRDILVLTDDARERIIQLVADLPPHNPHLRHSKAFFHELKMMSHQLPETLLSAIETFRSEPEVNQRGFLVIRNLPQELERATPLDVRLPVLEKRTRAEWINLIIASALGDPFAVVEEHDGRLPGAVIPEEGQEMGTNSASSKAQLLMHNDNIVALDRSASWLVNYCVRPDAEKKGGTTIASACDVIRLLSKETCEVLKQPIFRITAPELFKGKISPVTVPIIGGSEQFPWLTYREYGLEVDGDNYVAIQALVDLEKAVKASLRTVFLDAGDMILMRNAFTPWNMVHGRSIFKAQFDEGHILNRYLLRTYVHSDVTKLNRFFYPGTQTLLPTEICRNMV